MAKKRNINYKPLHTLAMNIINNKFSENELKKYKQYTQKDPLCVAIKIDGKIVSFDGLLDDKFPLYEKLLYSVRAAAFENYQIQPKELKNIEVEIAILTKPKLLEVKKADEYLSKIEIGKDGLILPEEKAKTVLLPYYAVQHNLSIKQFLEKVCELAELNKNDWKDLTTNIYVFSIKKII